MESLFSHLLERQKKREREREEKKEEKSTQHFNQKIPLWANSKHFVGVEC